MQNPGRGEIFPLVEQTLACTHGERPSRKAVTWFLLIVAFQALLGALVVVRDEHNMRQTVSVGTEIWNSTSPDHVSHNVTAGGYNRTTTVEAFSLQSPLENAETFSPCCYLSISWNPSMGIGNLMFQYATVIGLAAKYHLQPAIEYHAHYPLLNAFELDSVLVIPNLISKNWTRIGEQCCCCYRPHLYSALENANSDRMNFKISGYLQSFKYFENVKNRLIKKDFHFKYVLRVEAAQRRQKALNMACRTYRYSRKQRRLSQKEPRGECILVGIHIRRGDIASENSQKFGYIVVDEDYVLKAMRYMMIKFPRNEVVFYIIGNDYEWNRSIDFGAISTEEVVAFNWTFSVILDRMSATAEQDLSFFALGCDHMIVSTGTYSWWAGFLNGGTVVYHHLQAKPGSILGRQYVYDEYIPTEWVGL